MQVFVDAIYGKTDTATVKCRKLLISPSSSSLSNSLPQNWHLLTVYCETTIRMHIWLTIREYRIMVHNNHIIDTGIFTF